MSFPAELFEELDIRPAGRVLVLEADAGTCAALAKRVPAGGVIGLQSSDAALRAARREARDVDNVMFQPGDPADIPFQDELFDWIFCPVPPASFDEINRVLAPGGCVMLPVVERGGEELVPHFAEGRPLDWTAAAHASVGARYYAIWTKPG